MKNNLFHLLKERRILKTRIWQLHQEVGSFPQTEETMRKLLERIALEETNYSTLMIKVKLEYTELMKTHTISNLGTELLNELEGMPNMQMKPVNYKHPKIPTL